MHPRRRLRCGRRAAWMAGRTIRPRSTSRASRSWSGASGELGADLAAARGERDREREERHGERERADRVTSELANLARQFASATATAAAEARAREAALEARIEAVRAEAAAWRDRPWWRRLAG